MELLRSQALVPAASLARAIDTRCMVLHHLVLVMVVVVVVVPGVPLVVPLGVVVVPGVPLLVPGVPWWWWWCLCLECPWWCPWWWWWCLE